MSISPATVLTYGTYGHILEVWIKRDNNCVIPSVGKFYMFWSLPHCLYLTGSTLFYEKWDAPAPSSATGPLSGYKQFEWNRFMFKVSTTGATSVISVLVNNNLDSPEFTQTVAIPMSLQKIAFCFYDSTGGIGKTSCSLIGQNIDWGSAYYKNIRVWNISTASEWVAQAYDHSTNNL